MLHAIYKYLMLGGTPLLEIYLRRRTAQGKEDPERRHERHGAARLPRDPGTPLVWLHGASVGESLSLLALVERILRDNPDFSVMVTTGTVTSAKLMQQRLPQGAFHQYMPVDHPRWVARFLDHWQPDLAIWSESEFWPNMLAAMRARKIPALLVNARMSRPSFRRWLHVPGTIREMLSTFRLCLGQNAAEADRLRTLGAPAARASSNLKYAAAPLPFDQGKLEETSAACKGRTLLLWASTHAGEEEIAARIHQALKKKFPALLTVVVPRHPARGSEIASLVRKDGLLLAQRSAGEAPSAETDVYLADTLGELGLFYRLARNVVIGGSFADIGGHNPIEPGQVGCTVFWGPHMYNFITICEDFIAENAAVPVSSEVELLEKLETALAHPDDFASFGGAAQAFTTGKSRVIDELMLYIAPEIEKIRVLRGKEGRC